MPLSFQNKINFKNVPEQTIEEFNFTGGLVKDVHETKLKPSQSPNMENILFNDSNTIKTRNGYARYNGDPIGATSDEANTGSSTGTITLDDDSDWAAQTFQVGTEAAIVQADFYLAMTTTGAEQLVKAELWSGSTGPDAKLADSQILLVSGGSETEYSFRFRVPYTLAATTEYAIVLRPYLNTSVSSINSVEVHHTGAAYADGAAYNSTDNGVNWAAVASTDLKFNVYTAGNTGATGMIRYYNGSNNLKQTFVKIGNTLYRGNDSTGAMTTITFPTGVSLTAANYIDWSIVNDTLLIVDGLGQIIKYNGSTNANYSTGTITATIDSATITGSGTSWNTLTNAEVNEYIQLPDSKWYKITAIGSDTSLTIETTYQGSTLAAQSYAISPWGEVNGDLNTSEAVTIPQPDFIANHIDRVWTLKNNTLRFSVLDTSVAGEHFNDFDTANNAGTILIPSGKGDKGTGLYSLNNSLYIFQRRAIWRLYGNSPANFELRNVTNEIGMLNKRSLVEYNDVLLFLSDHGIYLFDGSNTKNITDGVMNTFIDSWASKTTPTATLWDNKYLIAYTPSGESSNSAALYYDITAGVFGLVTDVYVGAWSRWIGADDSSEIYFASSNQGTLYKWGIGGNDDGYPIHSLYDTPSLGFGVGINDKALKRVYLQQKTLGDWDVQVTQMTDISASTISGAEINLAGGTSSLWDVMEWDVDNWSSEGELITTRVAEFQGSGKYFKFRFEQTGYNQGYEILALVVTGRLRRLQ